MAKPLAANFLGKNLRAHYVPHKNGNFAFPLAKVPAKAYALEPSVRLATLMDFNRPASQAARAFGIGDSTMRDWRRWLSKLSSEKPTLVTQLVREPLRGKLIANEYYLRGSNWVRMNYELSNVATRGLLLWLKVSGFIDRQTTAVNDGRMLSKHLRESAAAQQV